MEMQTSADTGQEHVTGAERRITESACGGGWGGGGGGHQVHVLVLSGKNLSLNKFIKKAHGGDVVPL